MGLTIFCEYSHTFLTVIVENLRFGKINGQRENGDVVMLPYFIHGELELHPNKQNCIRSNKYINGK